MPYKFWVAEAKAARKMTHMSYITRISAAIPTMQPVILTQNLQIQKGLNTWK